MPSFYVGYFKIPSCPPLDSFLKVLGGWSKGVAVINGFGLDRYWPDMGPQVRLETKTNTRTYFVHRPTEWTMSSKRDFEEADMR